MARHRLQDPNVDVRVQSSAALRLYRSKESLHGAKEAAAPTRSDAISVPSACQGLNAQHVHQKQFQHDVEEASLAHRVPGDAATHLLRAGHLRIISLHLPPGRPTRKQVKAANALSFVQEVHDGILCVRDIGRGEHERRPEQDLVTVNHVPQRRPVSIRAHNVRHAKM